MRWRRQPAPPGPGDSVPVDTDVGVLALHAANRVMTPWIREHRCWEPDEAAWLRSVLRPGQTVVDVGANVGYFTVLMSRAVGRRGRVVAVEPEPANLALLEHNLASNRCRNVRVLEVAAWDSDGELALRRNPQNAGDHQVHPTAGDDELRVPCVTLDAALDEEGDAVDVVKIDTQGADHYVIAGLAGTLERSPQMQLLVEFWMGSMADRNLSAEDVLALYRRLERPIGLLRAGGRVERASDDLVLATAHAAPDHWVNLVLGAGA